MWQPGNGLAGLRFSSRRPRVPCDATSESEAGGRFREGYLSWGSRGNLSSAACQTLWVWLLPPLPGSLGSVSMPASVASLIERLTVPLSLLRTTSERPVSSYSPGFEYISSVTSSYLFCPLTFHKTHWSVLGRFITQLIYWLFSLVVLFFFFFARSVVVLICFYFFPPFSLRNSFVFLLPRISRLQMIEAPPHIAVFIDHFICQESLVFFFFYGKFSLRARQEVKDVWVHRLHLLHLESRAALLTLAGPSPGHCETSFPTNAYI